MIGIPSLWCNRRISAQSSTLLTLHTISEGVSFRTTPGVQFSPVVDNPVLRAVVEQKLGLQWFPQQISTESTPSTIGRLRGYKDVLKQAGITFDPDLVIKSFPEQEGGYEAAGRILAMRRVPTAVFCYNDRVAMGLYDRLKESGIKIPDDMAVVGFDDQEVIAAHLRPALTSVALPHYDLGALGVRTLLDRTGGGSLTPGVQKVTCPPVVREST